MSFLRCTTVTSLTLVKSTSQQLALLLLSWLQQFMKALVDHRFVSDRFSLVMIDDRQRLFVCARCQCILHPCWRTTTLSIKYQSIGGSSIQHDRLEARRSTMTSIEGWPCEIKYDNVEKMDTTLVLGHVATFFYLPLAVNIIILTLP